MQHQQREHFAKLYMYFTTIIGWSIIFGSFYFVDINPSSSLILVLFILFIGITEYYPFPVWKGFTTINFPLIFVMVLIYELPTAMIVYSLTVFSVNLLHERPARSIFFNPAQLAISLFLTHELITELLSLNEITFSTSVWTGTLTFLTFLITFYIINNLMVDLVLILRPQPYTFKHWKNKLVSESSSALFSILYGLLFYIIGNQNRGNIDAVAYFFFFSPLVALSIIGASFVRLNTEKNRLKKMFKLTRNLNTYMIKENGFPHSMNELKRFINCDEICLITLEDGVWEIVFPDLKNDLDNNALQLLHEISSITSFENRKNEGSGPLSQIFSKDMRSYIYAPLRLDEETLGFIVLAKSRHNSFIEEEKNIIATLANQLAATLKTRILVHEQQENHLLEERNRIARNIHDGIAQNLAAAVLQLESAKRYLGQKPKDSEHYINQCIENLRSSLWEVRNSIYTLRPPKHNQTGLIPAIHKRLSEFNQHTNLPIDFQLKGKPYPVSSMVERTVFDIFQESVRNSIKHSEASQIIIKLTYDQKQIHLNIFDDGKGFSLFHEMIKVEKEPHFGILQMNEIAEKINASLDINSKPGEGTTIHLSIPQLEAKGDEDD
ncbi:histidine kinase [Filobacillus milosensis]|uniref:histidine kinase n=1 Tax=Filobacillus milosensis TaxID=94137 RepID=A0A4Y8IFL0_9BACI|nr:sensor histidine kinase [Filobacillus milosensis]TFB18857.1 histidine kinase [Filobacillus milosensis]